MSSYSSVTSKGTITLPASMRKHLGIETGMKVQVDEVAGKITIMRVPTIQEVRIQAQAYMKQHNIKPLSDEELSDAIESARAESATVRYRRSTQ